MKSNFTLLVFFSILLISIDIQSQDIASTVVGGEYQFNKNQTSCLTEVQRKEVLQEIKSNISPHFPTKSEIITVGLKLMILRQAIIWALTFLLGLFLGR